MKRILIVMPNDKIGGAEGFMFRLARFLSEKKGEALDVVFLTKKTEEVWTQLSPHLTLHFSNGRSIKTGIISATKRIKKLSHENEYDYVFSSNALVSGYLGLIRKTKILKTKHLIFRESNAFIQIFKGYKYPLVRGFHKFCYPHSDLIICQTQTMLDKFYKHAPEASKFNFCVLDNPVDRQDIEKRSLAKTNDNFDFDQKYIVGCGRLIKQKGFHLLIPMFKKLNLDNFILVILGEGSMREELERIISNNNLEAKVIMPGLVDNPHPYFKNAELCVLSSLHEGFPNVLLEMMTLNNRVVSTYSAGGIDQIPGIFGCEPGDEDGLFSAMTDALTYKELNKNRSLFDDYLSKRTLDNYYNSIKSQLKVDV